MNYLILIIATILSTKLFLIINFKSNILLLKTSYSKTFKNILDSENNIFESIKQLKTLFIILIKILIILMPHLILVLLTLYFNDFIKINYLTWSSNLIIIFTFFCYIKIVEYVK